MKVQGTMLMINHEQQITEKFSKREFVIETDEEYPQKLIMEFVNEKCATLDNYKIGDVVDVSINLKGREWTNPDGITKYFLTIQAWNIQKLQSAPEQPSYQDTDDEDDDLPF